MDYENLLKEAELGRPVKSHSGAVQQGDIFVALSGTRVHGGQFIQEALERGAFMAVARQEDLRQQHDKILIHENPVFALGQLAQAYYRTGRMELGIIGITGTNGKTTVTYLLEHIFKSNGFKTGVLGTVNYRWGNNLIDSSMTTPDCLQVHDILSKMDQDGVEMVIMEVSSHALDQDRVAGITFDAGVFLNLTQDHLDYHKNMEDYFQAKIKLFLSSGKKKTFQSVINSDDSYGQRLLCQVSGALSFGLNHSVQTRLCGKLLKNDRTGITLQCSYQDQEWVVSSPLSGRHNGSNLLAAQGAGLALGLNPKQFECLENAGQVPGRLEKIINDRGLDIYVDYAHTPDALENVCKTIKDLDYSRLLVLFGCGGDRDKAKRPLMTRAAAKYADVVFLTSDNPRFEDPLSIIHDACSGFVNGDEYFIEEERRSAIQQAVYFMKPGDALLVAGKGHEQYQEIRGVRNHFNDAEEIRLAAAYETSGGS
ncbi:UDP-N-acetylmuramoyl-L-alanyl-D-glutamate--2,6-diaminopimelate ligase [Desulfonatronovibrio magnus]|uniref:UDP-N-acetylmuramoyl-L-alanyl-D-glutamate--2, 6-diaminopimelate ligase n=1 Tax=Desulfonatronovibrio magnus TaxID=698827 RepID=UPI0005EB64CE|nr:UDP-N-acetylmuramoyl-L-alanyl-D-glutamate--2,6-diaminopimelate ligase [Desulfonatronovibrio magnus]RQD67955.1 MAG: UDP-N-acetylmuramoyl-L-alanyl-D-glutamate--2,6-diaminopimelate ligase [Desulfonatronovibrio sp. MSAO_Bac4]